MPNFEQLGDSGCVDNKYLSRIILYVEGTTERTLLGPFLLNDFKAQIEVDVPSESGSGYKSVLNRVKTEREVNKDVYGMIDGDVLLLEGHFSEFITEFGKPKLIAHPNHEGIYCLPCWEFENLLSIQEVLPETIRTLQTVKDLRDWNERRAKGKILREAFRLSELSSLNLALLSQSRAGDVVAERTKSQIRKRRDLVAEVDSFIDSLEGSELVRKGYEHWRAFFRQFLKQYSSREEWYEQFVSRVKGKVLLDRLGQVFSYTRDYRVSLASKFRDSEVASRMFNEFWKV